MAKTTLERLDGNFGLEIVDRRYFYYARLQKFVY
jgi:hypothetical protein